MAVKGGIEIIKALARKLITSGQTGIKRIPTQMDAESKAGEIAAQIQNLTDLAPSQLDEAIKSEKQVLDIIGDFNYRSSMSKQKLGIEEFIPPKNDVYETTSILKDKVKQKNKGNVTKIPTKYKKPPSSTKKEVPIFQNPAMQEALKHFQSMGTLGQKGIPSFDNLLAMNMRYTDKQIFDVLRQYGWKPKIVPKAKGGLIDKPLSGRSRDI